MTISNLIRPVEFDYPDELEIETFQTELPTQDGEIDPETGLRYIAYPVEGDVVPESFEQFHLVMYLASVLEELYRLEGWHIMGDVPVQKTRKSRPLVPDLAVFKVKFTHSTRPKKLGTWKMWQRNRPAPFVVFEISSKNTWPQDLDGKPAKYLELGVNEYFAYDPNDPPYWKDGKRLRGWRYTTGQLEEIPPDAQGRLRSLELNSWLVPDGEYLRLYDLEGRLRLTGYEAEQQALETLKAKLRAMGLDPDKL